MEVVRIGELNMAAASANPQSGSMREKDTDILTVRRLHLLCVRFRGGAVGFGGLMRGSPPSSQEQWAAAQ